MKKSSREDLEAFLRRQNATELVDLLLDLAQEHDAVLARPARMQLADRPDKLAADFKKTLASLRRSTRFYDYREANGFVSTIGTWLDQVAHELLPKDPSAALSLFEAFIEADEKWFERVDDSDGLIGELVQNACRYWLQAAAQCNAPPGGWSDRLLALYAADPYGVRSDLLRCAGLLLDEPAQRELVARFESQLTRALDSAPGGRQLPISVLHVSGALSLLAESLSDPDIEIRATLRHSPQPNALQRERFARAFLDADRPTDALVWLQNRWDSHELTRNNLLADALERLGRFTESLPIRQQVFESTLSELDLSDWLRHLPQAEQPKAIAHARELALRHDELIDAAALLLELGDATAAEERLLSEAARIDGRSYTRLVPLSEALRARGCLRGEAAVHRALLNAILDRGYARAYGHAARYWKRLGEIDASGVEMTPLVSHEEFATGIRSRHRRKTSFWAYVNGTRRDRHDDDDDDDENENSDSGDDGERNDAGETVG